MVRPCEVDFTFRVPGSGDKAGGRPQKLLFFKKLFFFEFRVNIIFGRFDIFKSFDFSKIFSKKYENMFPKIIYIGSFSEVCSRSARDVHRTRGGRCVRLGHNMPSGCNKLIDSVGFLMFTWDCADAPPLPELTQPRGTNDHHWPECSCPVPSVLVLLFSCGKYAPALYRNDANRLVNHPTPSGTTPASCG